MNQDSIDTAQLAALLDRQPNFLCYAGELPPHRVVQVAKTRKRVFDVAELADWALSKTSHLTEAELRLDAALRMQGGKRD